MEGMTLTFAADGRTRKTTCIQCRQRKVRCREPPAAGAACDNCLKLEFTCSLASGGNGSRPQLKRVNKACTWCKDHKIRCSGGMPCIACQKRNISCLYPGSPAAAPSDEAASVLAGTKRGHNDMEDIKSGVNDPAGSSTSVTKDIVESFFRHVYPLPSYAFLHPATIRRKFREGSLEKSLANAIAAVASVRLQHVGRDVEREMAWVQETEAEIWQHLDSPSIARLQATLLIILYRAETGKLRRAFMLAALAGRGAAAMRLNHERPGAHRTSLEVRRRLMWSLKLVERYFSVGLPEFELCPVENLYIELPCVEYSFNREDEDSDDEGSYHLCVKLEMLRRDVMKLTRSLALCDQPFSQLPKLMDDFQQHLDRIGTQLPGGTCVGRVASLINSRWLPRHLLMRLSWHQCHCDLYRLILRNFRDSAPRVVVDALLPSFLNTAEILCVRHATAISEILALLSSISPRLLEFDTAICAYTASRILLFTARCGFSPDRLSEEFALSQAQMCLSTVNKFFAASILVKPIVEELTRLIHVFVAAEAPSRFSSPKPSTEKGKDPTAGLSREARIRQRLAIHSLLRQAEFSNGEDDEVDDVELLTAEVKPSDSAAEVEAGSEDTTPGTTGEGSDAWPHQLFAGGDLLQEEGTSSEAAPQGAVLTQRSFTFPWLQREEPDTVMYPLT